MKKKIIKDCVHNYIEIEVPFFGIIDTAGFQRLKSVKQTSYSSLYPSSTHNLFLNMSLDKELDTLVRQDEESIKFTFKIACLLHDYGHAPFSHTGEELTL